MDTLILMTVFTLTGLAAYDSDRLGSGGWNLWQQLAHPPEELDARLVRGLLVLFRFDEHAGMLRAEGDDERAAELRQIAHDSHPPLVADLEAGLERWHSYLPLLTFAWTATPLSRRGLHSEELRVLVACDAWLELLPRGRHGTILSLGGRMRIVRRALRRVRERLAWPAVRAAQPWAREALEHDRARLVRAGLECHEMLLRSLEVRREQLFGTRH